MLSFEWPRRWRKSGQRTFPLESPLFSDPDFAHPALSPMETRMRTYISICLPCLLCIAGCARSVSPDQLSETCHRRLESRANLTSDQASRFCSCFLDAALKKVPAETLASEFESGSSDVFKDQLRPE